jgi:CTP synthase (UTP-ammonia lyase)
MIYASKITAILFAKEKKIPNSVELKTYLVLCFGLQIHLLMVH